MVMVSRRCMLNTSCARSLPGPFVCGGIAGAGFKVFEGAVAVPLAQACLVEEACLVLFLLLPAACCLGLYMGGFSAGAGG